MDIKTMTSNESEQALIAELLDLGQTHLFEGWDEVGTNDEAKASFLVTLSRVNASYPGGIRRWQTRKNPRRSKRGK